MQQPTSERSVHRAGLPIVAGLHQLHAKKHLRAQWTIERLFGTQTGTMLPFEFGLVERASALSVEVHDHSWSFAFF